MPARCRCGDGMLRRPATATMLRRPAILLLRKASRRTLCSLPSRYDALVGSGSLRQDPQQRSLAMSLDSLRLALVDHQRHTADYAVAAREYHDQMADWHARIAAERVRQAEEWRQTPVWRRVVAQLFGKGPPPEVMRLLAQDEQSSVMGATGTSEAMAMPRLLLHHASADHDAAGAFDFATLQGASGKALLTRAGLPCDVSTMVLIDEHGVAHTRSTAALKVLRRCGLPYSLLYVAIAIPRPLRDLGYRGVAAVRYRLFGQDDGSSCRRMTKATRARFLA